MTFRNNAMITRRELMKQIAELVLKDELTDHIDRIPFEMRPADREALRCCVYKDRAVVRSKMLPLLGIPSKEDNGYTPLLTYARQALERVKPNADSLLNVVEAACDSCLKVNYVVTNVCQGCEGRYCELNCPKNAIEIANGKAVIHEEDCVNCGLCAKVCPFHAIVFQPVPCEEHCPVDAIRKDPQGHAVIDEEKCILCGKCIQHCPYGAMMERSMLVDVLKVLKSPSRVTALIAPALAGQFRISLGQLQAALLKMGFVNVVEVAEGADECTAMEAEEWSALSETGNHLLTNSCCSSWIRLVDKHLPEYKENVSHTPTPLKLIHNRLKKQNPEAETVFIGPCLSKRDEILREAAADYMLSTEELGCCLAALKIETSEAEEVQTGLKATAYGQGYAISGGLTTAINAKLGSKDQKPETLLIDGIDKLIFKKLKRKAQLTKDIDFMEVMCCEGGCINGCNNIASPQQALRQIQKIMKENINQ